MTNQNEPLQQKPSSSQENFLTLDEELLENVVGAGICASCMSPGKQTAPLPLMHPTVDRPLTHGEATQQFLRDHPSPEARANPSYDIIKRPTRDGRELFYQVPPSPSTSQTSTSQASTSQASPSQ
jgi:hypothetical protein